MLFSRVPRALSAISLSSSRLANLRFLSSYPTASSDASYYKKLESSNPIFDLLRINDFEERNLDALKSFLSNRSPSSLYLENCAIDEGCAKALGSCVAGGIVKTISVKSCEFKGSSHDILFDLIAQSRSLNLLAIANIQNPLLGGAIINFFARNNSVKDVIFNFCDFVDNSLVVRGAKKSASLDFMSFRLDKKEDGLIDSIDYLLRSNSTLRVLKFPLLEVNSAEIIQLAKALRLNSYLEKFEISNIGSASKTALEEAFEILSKTSCLEKLALPTQGDPILERKLQAIEEQNSTIKKAILDYSNTVLAPKLAKAIISEKLDDYTIDFKRYEEQLLVLTKKILLKGLSNEEILDVYQKWNSPFFRTRNGALKDYGNVSWPTLFTKKIIDIPAQDVDGEGGYSIAELNNPEELESNGKALRHCAGGATTLCLKEGYHVFALNFQGKAIATIAFLRDSDKRNITLADFSGINDSAPPLSIRGIPDKIIERLSREIDFDNLRYQQLERSSKSNSFLENVTSVIGFDYRDSARAASLLRLFRRCGPITLKQNFDELSRSQEVVKVVNLFGTHEVKLALMGRHEKPTAYVALPIEEVRENERINKEMMKMQIIDIQKSIDQIYGAKKIIVKKDQSGFGTVAFSFEEGCEDLAKEIKAMKAFRGYRLEVLQDKTLVARIGIKKVQELFKKIAQEKSDPSSSLEPSSAKPVYDFSKGL